MHSDAFGKYHPALTFSYFVCVIVLSVVVQNPIWIAVCILCAASYYVCVRGRVAFKVILGLIPVFVVVSAINPLFNMRGSTVLFLLFGERPYTLEALLYGMQTAGMFVSVLLWFGCYNHVMTSDKFTYLFGGIAPSIVLVLTMILRFIPTYMRKARQINTARECVGLSGKNGSWKSRFCAGAANLDSLVSWALEGSIITADSMRARGYGAKLPEALKRTQFAYYAKSKRDIALGACMALLLAVSVCAIAQGAAATEFIPRIAFAPLTPLSIAGFVAFTLFLALPTIVNAQEMARWRNSLSRI